MVGRVPALNDFKGNTITSVIDSYRRFMVDGDLHSHSNVVSLLSFYYHRVSKLPIVKYLDMYRLKMKNMYETLS
jgi:hypothetical protein